VVGGGIVIPAARCVAPPAELHGVFVRRLAGSLMCARQAAQHHVGDTGR